MEHHKLLCVNSRKQTNKTWCDGPCDILYALMLWLWYVWIQQTRGAMLYWGPQSL